MLKIQHCVGIYMQDAFGLKIRSSDRRITEKDKLLLRHKNFIILFSIFAQIMVVKLIIVEMFVNSNQMLI